MTDLKQRLPDEPASRVDAGVGPDGARSSAFGRRTGQAVLGQETATVSVGRPRPRPVKLTAQLSLADSRALSALAAETGLTPNAWTAALIRRRLHGRPTFSRPEVMALIAVQTELRRLGVALNQIGRALNTALPEGRCLDLELAYLEGIRIEIRGHIAGLREAFAGNLAYWDVEP